MSNQYHPAFNIDVKALAAGLVEMIQEHPQGACFKLGMFPADLMQAFENGLKEKIPDVFHWNNAPTLDQAICENGAEIRAQIVKDVCASALSHPACIV